MLFRSEIVAVVPLTATVEPRSVLHFRLVNCHPPESADSVIVLDPLVDPAATLLNVVLDGVPGELVVKLNPDRLVPVVVKLNVPVPPIVVLRTTTVPGDGGGGVTVVPEGVTTT